MKSIDFSFNMSKKVKNIIFIMDFFTERKLKLLYI